MPATEDTIRSGTRNPVVFKLTGTTANNYYIWFGSTPYCELIFCQHFIRCCRCLHQNKPYLHFAIKFRLSAHCPKRCGPEDKSFQVVSSLKEAHPKIKIIVLPTTLVPMALVRQGWVGAYKNSRLIASRVPRTLKYTSQIKDQLQKVVEYLG